LTWGSRLRFDLDLDGVRSYAESALAQGDLPGPERGAALLLVADAHLNEGRPAEAVAALRQLMQLRRHSGDWLLLADCERALGNQQASVEALAQAVRLNPGLGQVQAILARYYREHGEPQRAAWHERRVLADRRQGKRP
jgi:tetratricopeptide (TPR) repeat protein